MDHRLPSSPPLPLSPPSKLGFSLEMAPTVAKQSLPQFHLFLAVVMLEVVGHLRTQLLVFALVVGVAAAVAAAESLKMK